MARCVEADLVVGSSLVRVMRRLVFQERSTLIHFGRKLYASVFFCSVVWVSWTSFKIYLLITFGKKNYSRAREVFFCGVVFLFRIWSFTIKVVRFPSLPQGILALALYLRTLILAFYLITALAITLELYPSISLGTTCMPPKDCTWHYPGTPLKTLGTSLFGAWGLGDI